jgi:ribosomal protein S18 acetylase RimI-like enzyme
LTLKLQEQDIESYMNFVFSSLEKAEMLKKVKEWQAKPKKDLERNFICKNERNEIIASMNYVHFHEDVYHLKIPLKLFEQNLATILQINSLFNELDREMKAKGAKRIDTRIIPHPLWQEALKANNFQKISTRVEFKSDLSSLPFESSSSIEWKAVNLEGPYNLSFAAKVLELAGSGDPDWNAEEDNFGLLLSYLNDPDFNSNTDCIHLGFIHNEVAAIVIAQVETSSGWSRLTYMGLVPKFRGQGFGLHVHRHGFTMLRAQGGKEYQGGTLIENKAMIRLFEKNLCQKYRVLEEWHKVF